jgi:hypothetical protein
MRFYLLPLLILWHSSHFFSSSYQHTIIDIPWNSIFSQAVTLFKISLSEIPSLMIFYYKSYLFVTIPSLYIYSRFLPKVSNTYLFPSAQILASPYSCDALQTPKTQLSKLSIKLIPLSPLFLLLLTWILDSAKTSYSYAQCTRSDIIDF